MGKTFSYYQLKPSFQFSSTAMEGATNRDPVCFKTSDEVQHIYSQMKLLDQKVSVVYVVSALEAELEQAHAKLLAKRYMQDYEKERKARELVEEVCDELANEIGEDKAEVEVLKRESMKLREEVEEERRMLQMAEVWREEHVHMKLIDAKVALNEKY
ncbi:hypothetical protein SESBI_13017 [Sesbania bispinosa]|nr:hypothetical protein SESBI_13017 [Sesbania bispinosa]